MARGPAVRGTAPHDLPVDHSRDVFSVPNVITVLRLALIPLFYWFLVYSPSADGRNDLAFVLFTVAAATDWFDGLIARRTGHVTAIGKVIDPLVDRLLIASALIGLYMVHRIGLGLVLVLVGRDVYLLYGSWVLERHGRRIAITALGKTATAVLLVGFASLIWDFPIVPVPVFGAYELLGITYRIGGARPLGAYIVYVGVALSLSAAVQYSLIGRREYRSALAEERARAA